jgi:hypothetical protein
MTKKIIVCCYCYGDSFIKSLEAYGLKSFYESMRLTNKDENLEIIYHFYTYKRYLSKLKKVVSAFPINFLIHDIDKTGISEKIWEISIWNACLKTYDSDYFFLLIPDNFYYPEYFETILYSLKKSDAVIAVPPYINKESFDKEYFFDYDKIKKTSFKKIFMEHAHPYNFGLISYNFFNPKIKLTSQEQELAINILKDDVVIDVITAHPVALSSKRFSYDFLNFSTRINRQVVFKFEYNRSFISFSIDTYKNKTRLLRKSNNLNFLLSILNFTKEYLYHPWESMRHKAFSISLSGKKNNNSKFDIFKLLADVKFNAYIFYKSADIFSYKDIYISFNHFRKIYLRLHKKSANKNIKINSLSKMVSIPKRVLNKVYTLINLVYRIDEENSINKLFKSLDNNGYLDQIPFGAKTKEFLKKI